MGVRRSSGGGSGSTPTTSAAPTTEPVTTTAATPAAAPTAKAQPCPPPSQVVYVQIDVGGHEYRRQCVGPAQYKSDPRNAAYSYFAWETMLAGRDMQIVVTGGPLTMPVTSTSLHGCVATSAMMSSSDRRLPS